MDSPFAYSVDRTSFQQPMRTHVSEIDLSSRRATYEHAAPMQRRRPKYTRSKTGCLTCRKKKVKCDEAKPDCERCLNSGKPCTWPDPPVRRTPLVADEVIYTWHADEARPYTGSSSAGLSDASSTPSSLSESPRRVIITRHAYEEDRLAPPFLSRRHSAPSLKFAEKTVYPSPMRQPPLRYSQDVSVVHASRQPWNTFPIDYGIPMPPQMTSTCYPSASSQPTDDPPSPSATGLSPIPELSSLPYSHLPHAHSDDAVAGDAYPGLRYTLFQAHPRMAPTNPSGLIAMKQESCRPLECLPSPHHPRVSYPDASTSSWDQHGHAQENAAVAEPHTNLHEYYQADENPSPEPAWPTEPSYAYFYPQPYSEPHHETYQSTTDLYAHDHAPILHQPQPMQPAVIPYYH